MYLLPTSNLEIRATFLMHCFGQGIQFPSPYSTEGGGTTGERSRAGIYLEWREREGGSLDPKVEI